MKFGQFGKRIVLFFAVNILVVLTLSIVLGLLGVPRRLGSQGYAGLMIFCLVWGMGGAFVSLALSRLMAKWMMGVKVISPNTPDPGARQLVQMVHELAQRAGLPRVPILYYLPTQLMHAFTAGSGGQAAIALSDGLLQRLDLAGVEGEAGGDLGFDSGETAVYCHPFRQRLISLLQKQPVTLQHQLAGLPQQRSLIG